MKTSIVFALVVAAFVAVVAAPPKSKDAKYEPSDSIGTAMKGILTSFGGLGQNLKITEKLFGGPENKNFRTAQRWHDKYYTEIFYTILGAHLNVLMNGKTPEEIKTLAQETVHRIDTSVTRALDEVLTFPSESFEIASFWAVSSFLYWLKFTNSVETLWKLIKNNDKELRLRTSAEMLEELESKVLRALSDRSYLEDGLPELHAQMVESFRLMVQGMSDFVNEMNGVSDDYYHDYPEDWDNAIAALFGNIFTFYGIGRDVYDESRQLTDPVEIEAVIDRGMDEGWKAVNEAFREYSNMNSITKNIYVRDLAAFGKYMYDVTNGMEPLAVAIKKVFGM